jgi:hypothetical protein
MGSDDVVTDYHEKSARQPEFQAGTPLMFDQAHGFHQR